MRRMIGKMTLEEKTSQLICRSPAVESVGIPAYNWWNEALHGVARAGTATSFPQAIGMAASFDGELICKITDVISTEGRAKYNAAIKRGDRDIYKGLTFWCPNINIFRDPRWGRGHETFGEDPWLTSRLGVAYVKGLQGDGEHLKSAACIKHYAVHSGPEALRSGFNATVSGKDLWETYLPAFEACVKEAGVEGVMAAYNAVNGVPSCCNRNLLWNILREQWGFDGYVVSDCGAIANIHEHHRYTNTAVESAAAALNAGCDLNCGSVYLHVYKAVKDGLIEEEQVDLSLEHILMTRMRLGMFEECEYDNIPYDVVESREHCALAREAAARSMVLLKNNGVLPLDFTKPGTIGVIGPNADSREALRANYYGDSSHNTTILEGIQKAAGDAVRVLYSVGCHLYRETVEDFAAYNDRVSEALAVAEQSDVVILCLGLDATIEGEEGGSTEEYAVGDKRNLELPRVQTDLMEAVCRTGKPVVLCLMTGSCVDLRFAQEHADAVLLTWYPGAFGGDAAADILSGKKSPSGKLPVTFYRCTEDLPDFEDYSMKGRTYRYLEREPLYPFGFGLTYGDTLCREACLTEDEDGGLRIQATVYNAGKLPTGDVLQVYIKNLDSGLAVPNYSLCGAKPFYIQSDETARIELRVERTALNVADENGVRRMEGGNFIFYVGLSQPDDRSAALTGHKPVEIIYQVS